MERIKLGSRKRTKKRGVLAAVADGLLSGIDRLCEGVAFLLVSAMRGLLRLLGLLLVGLGKLLLLVLRLVAWPFMRFGRFLRGRRNRAWQCLALSGEEFEEYVARVLEDNGFRDVELTCVSGDQGVDILATRGGKRYAIQCKNYEEAVGNFAVQEAYAGCEYYECDVAAVICPGTYTRAARELAESTGVLLWDGKRLSHMMKISGRRPRRGRR